MKSLKLVAVIVFAAPLLVGVASAQAPGDDQPRPGPRLREVCQADIDRLCSDAQSGGGRVFECMREHQDQLSDDCKAALAQMRAHRHDHDSDESNDAPHP